MLGEEHPLTPGGDEITPTMKLRRQAITARYADVIESLCAGAGQPAQPGRAWLPPQSQP